MGMSQPVGLDWDNLREEYLITNRMVKGQSMVMLEHRTSKQEFIIRQISTANQNEMQIIHSSAIKKQLLKNRNVLNLEKIYYVETEEFCTAVYKLYLMFEYPTRTLEDYMNQKACSRKRFSDEELRAILHNVTMGMSYLQSENIRHQTLSSAALFYDQEETLVKVCDPIALQESNNYSKIINKEIHNRHVYLAPLQLKQLAVGSPTAAGCNPYKEDVFTMGMILLELGLTQFNDQVYINDSIDYSLLQEKVDRFAAYYSEELTYLMQTMLKDDRPDWLQLKEEFRDEEEIELMEFKNSRAYMQPTTIQHLEPAPVSMPDRLSRNFPSDKFNLNSKPDCPAEHQRDGDSTNRTIQYNKTQLSSRQTKRNRSNLQNIAFSDNQISLAHMESLKTMHNQSARKPTANFNPVIIEPHHQPPFQQTQRIQQPSIYNGQQLKAQPLKFEDSVKQQSATIRQNYSFAPPSRSYSQPQSLIQSNSSIHISHVPLAQQPLQFTSNIQTPSMQAVTTLQTVTPPVQTPIHSITPVQNMMQANSVMPAKPTIPQTGPVTVQSSFRQFRVQSYSDGIRYEGEVDGRGVRCGNGRLFNQNNQILYQGQFYNNRFHGQGRAFNYPLKPASFPQTIDSLFRGEEYWVNYEGGFKDDLRSGPGKITFRGGEVFEGNFVQGMVEGLGRIKLLNGKLITGQWRSNTLLR